MLGLTVSHMMLLHAWTAPRKEKHLFPLHHCFLAASRERGECIVSNPSTEAKDFKNCQTKINVQKPMMSKNVNDGHDLHISNLFANDEDSLSPPCKGIVIFLSMKAPFNPNSTGLPQRCHFSLVC